MLSTGPAQLQHDYVSISIAAFVRISLLIAMRTMEASWPAYFNVYFDAGAKQHFSTV